MRVLVTAGRSNLGKALCRAFEDAGFIWGGKWHEFDLMHFEYRPELICKAKRRARGQTP